MQAYIITSMFYTKDLHYISSVYIPVYLGLYFEYKPCILNLFSLLHDIILQIHMFFIGEICLCSESTTN